MQDQCDVPKKPAKPLDDDDVELVELTASELAIQDMRARIAKTGAGTGKVLIYAVRAGKKVRRGDANPDEFLKDPEKYLGEHFGGEDYKVDFQIADGDFAQRGVEFFCDVNTYGPPKNILSPSSGPATVGPSPEMASLQATVARLEGLLAKPPVDPLDAAFKLIDRMKTLQPAAPVAAPSDPMQVLSMEVLRRGLSGMEKVASGTGAVTAVEQIGIDAAKEFMPLIKQYLEMQMTGGHRKTTKTTETNGSAGGPDVLKKELLPQAAAALLVLAGGGKPARDGAVMIIKSVPTAFDAQLHALVKTPTIVDDLILHKPDLLKHRAWLDEVVALLVAEFEDDEAPALVA